MFSKRTDVSGPSNAINDCEMLITVPALVNYCHDGQIRQPNHFENVDKEREDGKDEGMSEPSEVGSASE